MIDLDKFEADTKRLYQVTGVQYKIARQAMIEADGDYEKAFQKLWMQGQS